MKRFTEEQFNHARKVADTSYRVRTFRSYAERQNKQIYFLNLNSNIADLETFQSSYRSWKRSMTMAGKSPFEGSWVGVIETTRNGNLHIHALVTFDKVISRGMLRDVEKFAAEKWVGACARRGGYLNEASCSIAKASDKLGYRATNYITKLVDFKEAPIRCPKPKLNGKSYFVSYNLPDEVKRLYQVENLPSYQNSKGKVLEDLLEIQKLPYSCFRKAWKN